MRRWLGSPLTGLVAFVAVTAIAGAQHDEHMHMSVPTSPRLGTVSFPNSGARAAQVPFVRGIALLHSFTYDDAATAFQDAERADPSFALPYWFEAFTHSHLLWGEEDLASARRALEKLGPTPAARLAKAKTARERAYGAAIEAFFAPGGEPARTHAFADSMTAIADRYPRDLEADAFGTLSLIMAVYLHGIPESGAKAAEAKAIALGNRVFTANPTHPGAAHYLIHVSDLDPSFAKNDLAAARSYARIAPDAEHALHMPSHVFLPLGLWSEVAASNERSWPASRADAARHAHTGADADYHSLSWLEYAYTQLGRWREARALIDTARIVVGNADVSSADYVDARYAASEIAFLYASATGHWDAAIVPPASIEPARSTRETRFAREAEFNRGVLAWQRRDTAQLAAAATMFRKLAADSMGGRNRSFADCAASQLEALLAAVHGDTTRMIERLAHAGTVQDAFPPIGPPPMLIAREMLGAVYMAQGKPRDAIAQYEAALVHTPKRSASLLGLARARAAAGDRAGARDAYRQLLVNWKHADRDVPELGEARRGANAA